MTGQVPQPTLRTSRLRLRPLRAADAAAIVTLAGDARVSRWLLTVPHPYPAELATSWIARTHDEWRAGTAVTWAIVEDGALVGAISLRLVARHDHAELGYWLGVPAWGRGLATEAARAVIGHAFRVLGLVRVFAQHLGGNPASGRVLVKVGMAPEGVRRRHVRKRGRYHDAHQYAVLREDWRPRAAPRPRPRR